MAACTALGAAFTSCGDDSAQGPGSGASAALPGEQQLPLVLRHEYGPIRHGTKSTHTFEVPLGKPLLPLAFIGDCSCSTYTLHIKDASGQLREVTGRPQPSEVVQPGELLVFALTIDTTTKEAVDAPVVQSRGRLVFGEPDKVLQRSSLPVLFSFGIDAPVRLQPAARVAFGALARCQTFAQTLELHGDTPGRPVRFGPVRCDDPHVHTELRDEEGVARLTVRYEPERKQPLGSVLALIEVETDLPDGYVVRIPVSGQLIPDVEVRPIDKISFGAIDFREPAEQSVLVVDHDKRRRGDWRVSSIVDEKGVSIADHFAPELLPDPTDERTTRVVLRYRGGLEGKWFRGMLTLAKPSPGHASAEGSSEGASPATDRAPAEAGSAEVLPGPPPPPTVVQIELVGFNRAN